MRTGPFCSTCSGCAGPVTTWPSRILRRTPTTLPSSQSDSATLRENGWNLVDPAVAAEPDGFRDYVRGSGAEFLVAQASTSRAQSG